MTTAELSRLSKPELIAIILRFEPRLTGRVTRNYGQRLLDALRKLFLVIHRRGEMMSRQFQRASVGCPLAT